MYNVNALKTDRNLQIKIALKQGISIKKIALIFNLCESTIRKIKNDAGIQQKLSIYETIVRNKQIIRYLNQGVSQEEIIASFGVSKQVITKINKQILIESKHLDFNILSKTA